MSECEVPGAAGGLAQVPFADAWPHLALHAPHLALHAPHLPAHPPHWAVLLPQAPLQPPHIIEQPDAPIAAAVTTTVAKVRVKVFESFAMGTSPGGLPIKKRGKIKTRRSPLSDPGPSPRPGRGIEHISTCGLNRLVGTRPETLQEWQSPSWMGCRAGRSVRSEPER